LSLDQLAAEKIGLETRFGFLALSQSGRGLAWTRSGAEIPSDSRPSQLYAKLFLEGKPDEKAKRRQQLKDGRSVPDSVSAQTDSLKRELGAVDRDKLEDYLGAIRETEQRLLRAEAWEGRPKPKAEMPQPKDPADRNDLLQHAKNAMRIATAVKPDGLVHVVARQRDAGAAAHALANSRPS
jgi:hypothetical protein